MNNKVQLLQEATPLRLKEVVALCNAKKPKQKVKENEETQEYVPNKRAT